MEADDVDRRVADGIRVNATGGVAGSARASRRNLTGGERGLHAGDVHLRELDREVDAGHFVDEYSYSYSAVAKHQH